MIVDTEAARAAAVDTSANSGGIDFKGRMITLGASRVEPQFVQWPNSADMNQRFKASRILKRVVAREQGRTSDAHVNEVEQQSAAKLRKPRRCP